MSFASLWAETSRRNAEEIACGRRLLSAFAVEEDLRPFQGSARAAFQRLQRYHVVANNEGGYRIEIPCVAKWARERKVGDVLGGAWSD